MPQIEDWVRMYSSTTPSLRLRAAHGLLERGHEIQLELLIDILVNLAHEGLGAKAESALLNRQDSELPERMIELLESSDDFVREVACTVLGRSGDTIATPHLLRMVKDRHMMVRRAAGFGLAHLKDRSALTQLHKLYDQHRNDDSNVVMAFQCALENLGEQSK